VLGQRDACTETKMIIRGHVNRESLPIDNSIRPERPHCRTNVKQKKTVGPLYYKVMVLHCCLCLIGARHLLLTAERLVVKKLRQLSKMKLTAA
jgi:hypothetical protein